MYVIVITESLKDSNGQHGPTNIYGVWYGEKFDLIDGAADWMMAPEGGCGGCKSTLEDIKQTIREHGCYCNINDRGTYYAHLIEAEHYAG